MYGRSVNYKEKKSNLVGDPTYRTLQYQPSGQCKRHEIPMPRQQKTGRNQVHELNLVYMRSVKYVSKEV